jgi:hypothetical protein
MVISHFFPKLSGLNKPPIGRDTFVAVALSSSCAWLLLPLPLPLAATTTGSLRSLLKASMKRCLPSDLVRSNSGLDESRRSMLRDCVTPGPMPVSDTVMTPGKEDKIA